MGLDPADPGPGSEQGLAVVGLGSDRDLYVIASEGHRLPLGALLGRALDLAQAHGATIVVERNHGGRALLDLLEQKMAERDLRVPYREVWASQGKRPRAEGAALLAEQGHLHIVGNQVELEEELCGFTGAPGDSFDRGDALVRAAAELAGDRGGTGCGGPRCPGPMLWSRGVPCPGMTPWRWAVAPSGGAEAGRMRGCDY